MGKAPKEPVLQRYRVLKPGTLQGGNVYAEVGAELEFTDEAAEFLVSAGRIERIADAAAEADATVKNNLTVDANKGKK